MIPIEEIKLKLRNYMIDKPIKKVYLFGSYARGEMDNQSDLDILLELDQNQKVGLLFSKIVLDIKEMFPIKVDVVSIGALYDKLNKKNPIIDRIEKDKVLICEK